MEEGGGKDLKELSLSKHVLTGRGRGLRLKELSFSKHVLFDRYGKGRELKGTLLLKTCSDRYGEWGAGGGGGGVGLKGTPFFKTCSV